RRFAMTYDLLRRRAQTKAFILAGTYVRPQQASADVKIFKGPREIIVTIDETPDPEIAKEDEPAGTVYKSTVMRLDLMTGKATTRSYFESERHDFSTYYYNGKVYRIVNGANLTITDFQSNAVIETMRFTK